jgi:hypothetical protein
MVNMELGKKAFLMFSTPSSPPSPDKLSTNNPKENT